MHVLALDRDREPVHHRIGHPDRRPGRGRQCQAVPGAHQDMPGSGGRGQPDPRRGRVRAQLWHILAGRLDVHGGHRHPGRVQQPGRCLLQDTGHQRGVPGRPVQQPPQQLEKPAATAAPPGDRHLASSASTMRSRPVTVLPSGALRSGVSKHDADNRHDGPPEDSKTATRATLVSVRRPATGYPPPEQYPRKPQPVLDPYQPASASRSWRSVWSSRSSPRARNAPNDPYRCHASSNAASR